MTTKPYPYRRLPTATSIRLLSLYTYKENSPNGICSLDIVDMNENPQFDALSYTWGDPVPEKLRFDIAAQRDYNANQFLGNTPVTGFLCDGVLLKLEPNLHDALIALLMQNSARNIPRQRYWIDALCINQADMEEKSHQIALMGRIYSVAESVIVWLGLQDESGVDALKLIVQLSEFPSDSWESIRKTSVNVKEPSGHPQKGLIPTVRKEWVAFGRLMLRRWFFRVWILQEVILAKTVILLYGHQYIQWEHVERACMFLEQTNWDVYLWRCLEEEHPEAASSAELLLRRFTVPVRTYLLRVDLDLRDTLNVLYISRYQNATDQRDYVYGLLGLIKFPGISDNSTLIRADYTITTAEAFTNLAWAILCASSNPDQSPLALLSLVQDVSITRTEGLPSWVPDWSVPAKHNLLESLRPPDSSKPFRVCGNLVQTQDNEMSWTRTLPGLSRMSLQSMNSLHQGNLLTVNGMFVDEIVETTVSYYTLTKYFKLASVLELVSKVSVSSYRTGEHITQVIWKCLIADSVDRKPAEAHLTAIFACWVVNKLQGIEENLDQGLLGRTEELISNFATNEKLGGFLPLEEIRSFPAQMGQDVWDKTAQSFEDALAFSYIGRRMFRTKLGLLGSGPESVRPGDSVYILSGANVPFILRGSQDTRYRLIGETYVHGIMYGEYFNANVEQLQEIELE